MNDGGPAFPTPQIGEYNPQFGMSLRDYFAGQALTGLLPQDGVRLSARKNNPNEESKYIAAAAYQIADAMLAERARER